MSRGAGILMHIASLPGEYGIGTLGKEAFKFAEFLETAENCMPFSTGRIFEFMFSAFENNFPG